MNKGIIIIGGPLSGKSVLAKHFVKNYKKEEIALIDGRFFSYKNNFKYQNCTKETKVLIIEDILPNTSFDEFFSMVSGNLVINRCRKEPFEINIEKLIVVCSAEIKETDLPTDQSFIRRFEIINMNSKVNEVVEKGTGKSLFMNFEKHLAINLQNEIEKNKSFLEMFSWIKDAFGNHVNEDYGDWTLSDYIDDKLKEVEKQYEKQINETIKAITQ